MIKKKFYDFRGCTHPVCDAKIEGDGVGDVSLALLDRISGRVT